MFGQGGDSLFICRLIFKTGVFYRHNVDDPKTPAVSRAVRTAELWSMVKRPDNGDACVAELT